MPYLRFSRDKRGYENTYVFHGATADGRSRPRLLYWFRTPPSVKVGRLSLDPAAIRAIEENNPDVRFDWNKMLKVRGTPNPRQRGQDQPRARDRRGRRPRSETPVPAAEAEAPQVEPAPVESPSHLPPQPESAVNADELADELAAEAHLESLADAESVPDEVGEHLVVTLMGHETLARLRARYAEILARIDEKPLDPGQLETIRGLAEKLNPDRWSQIEEAVAGIERFETEAEVLRAQLGRRPPRHRRDEG